MAVDLRRHQRLPRRHPGDATSSASRPSCSTTCAAATATLLDTIRTTGRAARRRRAGRRPSPRSRTSSRRPTPAPAPPRSARPTRIGRGAPQRPMADDDGEPARPSRGWWSGADPPPTDQDRRVDEEDHARHGADRRDPHRQGAGARPRRRSPTPTRSPRSSPTWPGPARPRTTRCCATTPGADVRARDLHHVGPRAVRRLQLDGDAHGRAPARGHRGRGPPATR